MNETRKPHTKYLRKMARQSMVAKVTMPVLHWYKFLNSVKIERARTVCVGKSLTKTVDKLK